MRREYLPAQISSQPWTWDLHPHHSDHPEIIEKFKIAETPWKNTCIESRPKAMEVMAFVRDQATEFLTSERSSLRTIGHRAVQECSGI